MGLLDGFKVIDAVTGVPSVSITKNGIAFNKTVVEKMGCPSYVCAMIDKENKRFAIVPCEKDAKGHRAFYKKGRSTSYGVRWNNADLRMTIEMLMDWNLEESSWKVVGTYYEEENVLMFDLKEAEMMDKRQ